MGHPPGTGDAAPPGPRLFWGCASGGLAYLAFIRGQMRQDLIVVFFRYPVLEFFKVYPVCFANVADLDR